MILTDEIVYLGKKKPSIAVGMNTSENMWELWAWIFLSTVSHFCHFPLVSLPFSSAGRKRFLVKYLRFP